MALRERRWSRDRQPTLPVKHPCQPTSRCATTSLGQRRELSASPCLSRTRVNRVYLTSYDSPLSITFFAAGKYGSEDRGHTIRGSLLPPAQSWFLTLRPFPEQKPRTSKVTR